MQSDKFKTTVEIRLIGPATASEWLSNKWGEQRGVRTGHVARMADDMQKNRFRLSPDAILRLKHKLDDGGWRMELANGQHRLEAVVKSKCPQMFLVMESEDEELYKVLDAGVRRTIGDNLIGLPYANNLPPIAQWVLSYYNRTGRGSARDATQAYRDGSREQRKTNDSRWDLIEYCENNANKLAECVAYVHPLYGLTRLLPISIGAALYFLAMDIGKRSEAEDFLRQVYENAEDGAAQDLRNRLINNRGAAARLQPGMIFALTLRAFRSFLNGTRPAVLKWERGDPFPRIVDDDPEPANIPVNAKDAAVDLRRSLGAK